MHFIFFVGGGGGVTPTINYLSTQGEYQTPTMRWVLHATKLSLVLVVYNSLP